MKEIDHRSRMSEQSPAISPLLIKHLKYNGMTDYGDQILLSTTHKIPELESDTNNFHQNWSPSSALFPKNMNPSHLSNTSPKSTVSEKQPSPAPQTSLQKCQKQRRWTLN